MDDFDLPPGYSYELLVEDDPWAESQLGIVDRAMEPVVSVPASLGSYYDAVVSIWTALEDTPEIAGIHTAVFLTWRLRDSPLDRLVELEQ